MEEEKESIKKRLEEVSHNLKLTQTNFQTEQKLKNRRIKEFNEKMALLETQKEELSNQQKEELGVLRQQISEMESDKQKALSEYKLIISQLGEKYDALQEKYEELIPLEEQRKQLQKQVKVLLKERKALQDNFSQKESNLLEEISQAKTDLQRMQKDVNAMKISSTDSKELIAELEQKLLEKERELKYTQNLSAQHYNQLQEETIKKIREYENKTNDLEFIITYVMTENAKYKEMLAEHDKEEEAKQYLQIVNQGISQMKDGYMLYQRNANEETLRKYLLKVKHHYESEIAGLKEDLLKKEEELKQEKIKNQKMMHDWRDSAEQVTEKYPIRKKRKKKIFMKAAILFTILGVIAVGLLVIQKNREDSFVKTNNEQFVDEEIVQASAESVEPFTVEELVIESETVLESVEEITVPSEMVSEAESVDVFSTEEGTMEAVWEGAEEPETTPSKLDELLAKREWADSVPKALEEIPGIEQSLVNFVESEMYVNSYDDFKATLDYLAEEDIYSVSNKDAKI